MSDIKWFGSKHVPCYLERMIVGQNEKLGNDDYKAVELYFRVEPLTAAMAAELSDAIKGKLFRRNDGESDFTCSRVRFTDVPDAQSIEFRLESKSGRPTLVIAEASITDLSAAKPKKGNHWSFTFRALFVQVDGQQMLELHEGTGKQWFLTFEPARGGLFDQVEAEERRESPDAAPVRTGRRRRQSEDAVAGATAAAH